MKKDLMDILACPMCKGPLELTVEEEDNGEVITGSLYCSACSHTYPIKASCLEVDFNICLLEVLYGRRICTTRFHERGRLILPYCKAERSTKNCHYQHPCKPRTVTAKSDVYPDDDEQSWPKTP